MEVCSRERLPRNTALRNSIRCYMLVTEDDINEHSQNLLISFFEAKDVYENAVEMSNNAVSDLHKSVMDLVVKSTRERYVIRHTHMRIIATEFMSSINDYRWN